MINQKYNKKVGNLYLKKKTQKKKHYPIVTFFLSVVRTVALSCSWENKDNVNCNQNNQSTGQCFI